uniref:Uncharacterized protein n=1 Tax=Ciona savignyi TaxID=51511 RepID=H2Z7N0_CIOSA
MSEFALDSSQSPPVLFQRISKLLAPWPQLIQGFAPFLLPEQAYACGLLPEQQVYARARKFLRQLEIRFIDNPQHLNKIINTFRCVAESGVYKEKEMKSSILSMLKSDPYLQEEFLMFFDDERPPESRLNGNWEEIYWTDDLAKDSISTEFEEIHIPISTEDALHTTTDDAPAISSSKTTPPTKQVKSTNQQRSRKRKKIPKHQVKEKDAEDWTSHPRFEEETEDEEPNLHTKPVTSSPVPQVTDIGVISEDALSCSPFKRHTLGSEETVTVSMHKPPTPTGTRTSQETVSISDYKLPSETQSTSQCSSSLPLTPTGSQSPKPSPARENDINLTQCMQWTREDDATLLGLCKLEGSSEKTFLKVAETLHRLVEDVEKRFQVLMNLLSNVDAADTDTGSLCTDETDSDDSIE